MTISNETNNGALTVSALIELLQDLPGDLPVYLGDWNEQYACDHPMVDDDAPRVVGPTPPGRDGVSQPKRVLIGTGR